MRLTEYLAEASVSSEASRIIHNALKATGSDAKVKISNVSGQGNLVNIVFPVQGMHSGRFEKDGVLHQDHKADIASAMEAAKKLEAELKGTVNLEDSSIEERPRGVILFVVSDDFL